MSAPLFIASCAAAVSEACKFEHGQSDISFFDDRDRQSGNVIGYSTKNIGRNTPAPDCHIGLKCILDEGNYE